ncbi:TfpX/TfpZ family type IV pilin accessory protein [Rhodanobacter sp. DHB23]|uniref:TfpX/TfpZ family type IV pilin accessory protein n=1 Tax=Rhodanobacter sp. DHB23 TaxID=2775923 RepID=UPI0017826F28|nr:hypothetical protein [Rhodanobacter sp. DHB23]
MSRWKAAATHLAISLALGTVTGAVLYFLWFPQPYFIAAGASRLMLVLMGVDVCIGPLLTLLAANPRKPKRLLKLDLAIIATLQALAFGYGIHAIATTRPVFVVAESDRFILVSADEISDADLAQARQPAFRSLSWTGPLLVGAIPPSGNEAGTLALHVIEGGKDIDRLPRYYVPYDHVTGRFMRHARTLGQLDKATADQRRRLERLQAKIGADPLLALPLQRGDKDFTVILSPRTKKPLEVLALNSW